MSPTVRSAAALVVTAMVAATLPALAAQHGKKPAAQPEPVAYPSQQHQFVTVDEFTKAGLSPHTAVSVEGYTVLGFRTSDGSETLDLVDSIDHVLSPTDADNFAHGGAKTVLPALVVKRHPRMSWSAKGIERFVMYTGAGRAQKPLNDTVAKVRVTGFMAGHAAISPVTKVEYQDENGDWKAL